MHCNQGAELVRHYNNIVLFWEETDFKKKFLPFSSQRTINEFVTKI